MSRDDYRTFMGLAIAGRISDPDAEIDIWIDAWHRGALPHCELHDFLGMTWEEYGEWLTKPGKLGELIEKRKAGYIQ